ncbi:MAG: hypothetical protein HY592_05625 [Candidatus Omnitrophica bacterium]|nr:hypothetical protein [Candidatus Omnitrophota bacterium]
MNAALIRRQPFLAALFFSLLWHFFWFFSISVVVNPRRMEAKPRPQLVSLGPVLDDTIFRTLVESKAQLSSTFYKPVSDFSQAIDPAPPTLERHVAGDVVSVPLGRKLQVSFHEVVGGVKSSPEEPLSRMWLNFWEDDRWDFLRERDKDKKRHDRVSD